MGGSVQTLSTVPDLDAKSGVVRVLIADDHPLIIAGIRRTIEHLDDIEIVGEAHSGPELVAWSSAGVPRSC